MKVLLVTGIYPPEIGGPSTVIDRLAHDLRERGHDAHVLTYGDAPSSAEVTRVSRRGSVLCRYGRMMRAIAKKLEPETVVLCTDVFSVGIPTRLALMGRKNRLVVRLGGEWVWEDAVTNGRTREPLRLFWREWRRTQLRTRLMIQNVQWILTRASRVAVTSSLIAEVLDEALPSLKDRFVEVPNVPVPSRVIKRSDDGPHDPLRLIYVGRFAPVKNVPFLAQVLKTMKDGKKPDNISCTFIGDGMELAKTEEILDGVSGMKFLRAVSQDCVAQELAKADVLVLPSLTDICPNSVIEALAAGVPVVMTSEHGLPSDTQGIVTCSPTDASQWREEIRRLEHAEHYRELRARIRLPAATSHTLVEVLEQL